MKIIRGLYTAYGLVIFTIVFAALLPLLFIPILFPKQFRLVGLANRLWAYGVFTLIGMPFSAVYKSKLDRKRQYVFCPNHFSYMDIAVMGLNRIDTVFVGKSDMENIPVFGYMYRKLHITVDRKKLKSRAQSMVKSFEAIDAGKSLVIFPEGGIITDLEPVMGRFKDGAFRLAIEKQIPVVPVTIPYNWIILPANMFLLRWGTLKVIFHEPIETKGLTLQDLNTVKEQTQKIIQTELDKYVPHENRSPASR